MPRPAVAAAQLTRQFGPLVALDGLDLAFGPGGIVCYLGPNGARKTTTPALTPLRFVTPWHWYLGRRPLAAGPAVDAIALPLAVSAVLLAVGVHRFERRDLR